MIAVKVAGYHEEFNWLGFDPRPTSCGGITDGVSLSHQNCEQPANRHQTDAGWVISFADLERMYEAAKAARIQGEPPPPPPQPEDKPVRWR